MRRCDHRNLGNQKYTKADRSTQKCRTNGTPMRSHDESDNIRKSES
jgi:hypothetical protein